MAKPVTTTKEAGLVETTPARETLPAIDEAIFAQVLERLYEAIGVPRGLYRTVTMETHAPQRVFYPGSPAVQPVPDQQDSFDFQAKVAQIKKAKKLNVLAPGTLEHRRWLWFTTLTDRREQSRMVYRAHCYIYRDHPRFYGSSLRSIQPADFIEALGHKEHGKSVYKIGSPKQSAKYWLICAKTLFEEFDGDPVKLLEHAGWSVQGVMDWKRAQKKSVKRGGRGYDPIPGWGPKLVSLYFLYLSELGYTLPSDAFASDVHLQAFILQVGALNYGDKDTIASTKLAELARVLITTYCNNKGYDINRLAHASWLLGSALCTDCSKRVDVPNLCPIYDQCGGRVDTSFYWKKGQWPQLVLEQPMNKGGCRPPFGMPTEFRQRLPSRKGHGEGPKTIPLFPVLLVCD